MATANTAESATKTGIVVNDFKSEAELLAKIESTIKNFKDGDVIEGIVVKIERDEVLLDVGYKTEGVIPARELSVNSRAKIEDLVTLGEVVEALVIQKEDKEGRLILSKKRAQYEKAWRDVEAVKEKDETIQGTIIEIVKGGVIVDIGIRGFLPASLIDTRRIRDLDQFIGETMDLKIIELDKARNNVVLSRRSLIENDESSSRNQLLSELKKGQIRKGVISSIVSFGAFVDLGGIDGLVHVSELSWKHIEHPSEVVKVGQEVTVEVVEIENDRDRVSLSIKSTEEDPWQVFARHHAIGQIVPGVIGRDVAYGVFVTVANDIEGLVHISELSSLHIKSADQIVTSGSKTFAKIVDIDLERRRISLSIKQANDMVDLESEEFDPALYGAANDYDENGNYKAPEGFDETTNEWLPGFEKQKAEWEANYLAAKALWEAHRALVVETRKLEAEIAETLEEPAPRRPRKKTHHKELSYETEDESAPVLADNEALAALSEQLKAE